MQGGWLFTVKDLEPAHFQDSGIGEGVHVLESVDAKQKQICSEEERCAFVLEGISLGGKCARTRPVLQTQLCPGQSG